MNRTLTDSIALREVEEADFSVLRTLMEDVYTSAYAYLWQDEGLWYLDHVYSEDAVVRDIHEEGSDLMFVLYEGEAVGILKVRWQAAYPDAQDRRGCHLHRIYLHPSVHGQGVAAILMGAVIEESRKRGAEILWLDCMESAPRALGFYEKHGFTRGRLYHLDFAGLHDQYRGILFMHKEL